MRYAPFNCAKFSLFSALSQSRNPAVVCQMAAIKTKGRITGGSENVCIYVGNRRVTSALVLSTEQPFGTVQHSTSFRKCIFLKSCYEKECEKT